MSLIYYTRNSRDQMFTPFTLSLSNSVNEYQILIFESNRMGFR